MNNQNLIVTLTIMLASCLIFSSNSFAAPGTQLMVNVEGLTLDEAAKKYGIESDTSHPLIFEVNAESGAKKCEVIAATECSKACPTAKIFYQSSKVIPNYNGTSTMKVDIYYDVNEATVGKAKMCNV